MKPITVIVSLLIILLAACAPVQGSLPEQPTQDTDAVAHQIATGVAATVAAQAVVPQAEPTQQPTLPPAPTDTPEPTAQPDSGSAPGFAPLRVVFSGGDRLFLWEENGAAMQLADPVDSISQVALSPDRTLVAYVTSSEDGLDTLHVVAVDGSNDRVLLTPDDLAAIHPESEDPIGFDQLEWHPIRHEVYFTTRAIAYGTHYFYDLQRIDAESGTYDQVLPANRGGHFVFSPSGDQVMLSQAEEIGLASADGSSHQVLITFDGVSTYSEWAYSPAVVWLPDGSAGYAMVPPADWLGVPDARTSLWRLPANGESPQVVTAFPSNVDLPSDFLSPQLNAMVYLYAPGPDLTPVQLRLAGLDLSSDQVYASGQITWGGWNPSGTAFLFTEGDPAVLYLGRIGEAPLALPDIPAYGYKTWVDDQRFLMIDGELEDMSLKLVSIDGSQEMLGTDLPGFIQFDFQR